MKFNRTTRRLLEYLQKANRPKVIDIIESVHILAQAGLVEYEAYQVWPDMVLAWAAPLTDSLHTKPKSAPAKCDKEEYLRRIVEGFDCKEKSTRREQDAPKDMLDTICQLEQEADELTQLVGELYREPVIKAKAEYTWLASRNNNPVKENTMATITLDIETMNVDSLGAKMQGVIIRAEVPDSDLPAFLTLVSKLTTNKESHVCKCEASNGDKRPQTSNVD